MSGNRVLITGLGICSPIGNHLAKVWDALRSGRSGIRPIQSFDCSRMTMKHAGEVVDFPSSEDYPDPLYRTWDRGTRMAMHAAGDALRDAGLIAHDGKVHERIGVCIGTSGSGQYQNARFRLDKSFPIDPELVFYLSRNSPHFQSSQVAAHYGIEGPNLAIGAATAGGGIALSTALNWLKSGRLDIVLVGGSEAFSLLNVLGFDQLGLSLPHPCTPFSGTPGMTFGEGAGFLILETEASASCRGATSHAELLGVGIRADGFDPIQFDPSGDGQSRAMRSALDAAGLVPEDIDWIRASGTGGREQDLAETLAIKSVFASPPPVSSLEPYFGHANGAGPMIQLVASILCLNNDWIPPTLGYGEPRVGCDIDYVVEGGRSQVLKRVMCNTLAFGGVNCSLIVGKTNVEASSGARVSVRRDSRDEVVITGIGVISAQGCGNQSILNTVSVDQENLSSEDRLGAAIDLKVGLVRDFSPRKYCPSIPMRGTDLLTQYAAAATRLALDHAELRQPLLKPNRFGLATAISRPSGTVFENLFRELQISGFRPSIGRLMLRNGRFMIASQLANWFDLRGPSATVSLGIGSGLHTLISAADQLRIDSAVDGTVVVACDELSSFTLKIMQQGRMLAASNSDWQLYSKNSQGIVPGEGAVAVVLERRQFAEARGAKIYASIVGSSLGFEAHAGATDWRGQLRSVWEGQANSSASQAECYEDALAVAGVKTNEIECCMGNGTGIWDWDRIELEAVQQVFGDSVELACVNSSLGVCEASSALFNLAYAIGRVNGRSLDKIFVSSRTEHGHNAALILKREEQTCN